MDLELAPEDRVFRDELRAWLRASLPRRTRGRRRGEVLDAERVEALKARQRKLLRARYLAPGWPREHGGQGASLLRQTLVGEELARQRAPGLIGQLALAMVGPTLIQWGSGAQRRFLLKILSAEEIWRQRYSEPRAGSDLASLRTAARREGDAWRVKGHKIWTTNAQIADWMFCLVRTDPAAPKHRGITYLLIDMRSPGISVRPLVQMTGDAGFNELFLDDVRVPLENTVGEPGQGWERGGALRFLGAMAFARIEVLFPAERVRERVKELAGRLVQDYGGSPFSVLCIDEGARRFVDALVSELAGHGVRPELHTARARRTRGTALAQVGVDTFDLEALAGRDVLVVDDIADEGETLRAVLVLLAEVETRSLRTAVLVDKREARRREFALDYVGFEVERGWVVGFGMDLDGRYRELDYVGRLVDPRF
jgi:hypoxanthine phosphoribosyltransferase